MGRSWVVGGGSWVVGRGSKDLRESFYAVLRRQWNRMRINACLIGDCLIGVGEWVVAG